MTYRLIFALIGVVLLMTLAPSAGQASDTGLTALDVSGERVKIYRDDFGVPHIFAEPNRGLFEAYGIHWRRTASTSRT
jgi:acyl-homoserine lactone acylase PvdQ